MPITEGEWESIRSMVLKLIGGRDEDFTTARVLKRDVAKGVVYVEGFGDQPVPIIGFDYEVKYYDEVANGRTVQKKAKVKMLVPEVGELVLVASELGTRRLPRCLGVIKSKNWVK